MAVLKVSNIHFMLLDGKCPKKSIEENENWKYNTTLCQKAMADYPPLNPSPGDYCCELKIKGSMDWPEFKEEFDKLTEDCFAKNDDHKPLGIVNGDAAYDINSVFCQLTTISQ